MEPPPQLSTGLELCAIGRAAESRSGTSQTQVCAGRLLLLPAVCYVEQDGRALGGVMGAWKQGIPSGCIPEQALR